MKKAALRISGERVFDLDYIGTPVR